MTTEGSWTGVPCNAFPPMQLERTADLQPSAITADLFDAPLGLSSQQCTLSAASDKGPRAATLRQTTLRLHCRAQLAQSTSKSLSQNIVGKLHNYTSMHNKQLVATTLMHSCQMHSCQLTSRSSRRSSSSSSRSSSSTYRVVI